MWEGEVTQACLTLCDPMDSPGKNTGVDYHFLLQGIFPTQGSNPGLPHCRQMLYSLSHQGSLSVFKFCGCNHHLQWFWSPQNKVSHCFHCFLIYLSWSDRTGCHDLSFLNVELLANFFTLLKRTPDFSLQIRFYTQLWGFITYCDITSWYHLSCPVTHVWNESWNYMVSKCHPVMTSVRITWSI